MGIDCAAPACPSFEEPNSITLAIHNSSYSYFGEAKSLFPNIFKKTNIQTKQDIDILGARSTGKLQF